MVTAPNSANNRVLSPHGGASPSASLTVHVRGSRPTFRELASEVRDVVVALPLFLTAPLFRHWHRRWGATDAEVASPMPGDELVPGCQYVCTRALSIAGPPEAVWPWLVQVGFGKAGFYSNDLLDNAGHPSASRIEPEIQKLEVGDWVPMFSRVNDTTAFRVAALNEGHHLVWAKPDSTWVWQLAREGKGTRLVTRLRILYDWRRPGGAVLSLLLNEFGDFPMMRKMLETIKRRVESSAPRTAEPKLV
jgi:hypothetical protein